MTKEDFAIKFNSEVLPSIGEKLSMGDMAILCMGLPYCKSIPKALVDVGYATTIQDKSTKVMVFEADPTHVRPYRPLTIAEADEVLEKCKGYCNGKRDQARLDKRTEEMNKRFEREAIAFLKGLGYKIMKPTTTYEEV